SLHSQREATSYEQVVVIKKHEISPAAGTHSFVTRCSRSCGSLSPDDTDARIRASDPSRRCAGVVDYQDFEVGKRLINNGGHSLAQEFRSIVSRDDDAEHGRLSIWRFAHA